MNGVLLVGAADTGRAPMAAALLRRLAAQRSLPWPVGSAGVVGHDGDLAEVEARDTMAHMGLDISEHIARSITGDMVSGAALLVAVDSGVARVLRARFPGAAARVASLGELAGRERDIPDPFRMQIGAWMTYARELELLLEAAMPRLVELLGDAPAPEPALPGGAERAAAVERMERLLRLAAELPGVVDWGGARGQVDADLGIAAAPCAPGDLAAAYAGLLRAALALTPSPPSAGQLAALREAVARLRGPIGQDDLAHFSGLLPGWAAM